MAEYILGCRSHFLPLSLDCIRVRLDSVFSLPLSPSTSLVTMAIPTFISQYPGVLWLLFSLPRIIAPAFLVYTLVSYSLALLVGWDSLDGSRWKVATVSALTFPLAFFCSITWNRLKVAYRASKFGATTPPVIAGRLPGSLDIVWPFAKNRFTAYPGENSLAGGSSRARRLLRSYCRTCSSPVTAFDPLKVLRRLLIGLCSTWSRRPY